MLMFKSPPVIGYAAFNYLVVITVAERIAGGCLVSRTTMDVRGPTVVADALTFVPNVVPRRTEETVMGPDGPIELYVLDFTEVPS